MYLKNELQEHGYWVSAIRKASLYLDREAVFVPNLDGGVLQRKMRKMIIIEIWLGY